MPRCRPTVVLPILLTAASHAQWTTGPSTNLAIANRPQAQVQPKIRSTSDGGVYISWFDNATGGYDVYLQRLDPAGIEQWPHNGVLILDRAFTSTQDYGLVVDAQDHALITYRDDEPSQIVRVGVNRVSPDGTLLWGPTGVLASPSTPGAAAANPKICATSDGDVVVAWSQNNGAHLQRLDDAGVLQWPVPVSLPNTGNSYTVTDVVPADDGGVILGLATGQLQFHAQKVSSTGQLLWGAPIQVGLGNLQNGYFPTFLPDGLGGAVFGWYQTTSPRNAYVQRINAAGMKLFPADGLPVSTNTTEIRLTPSIAYNQATGDIYAFWVQSNTVQSLWGVYGQKVSAAGVRQWTDAGRQVVPVGPLQESFVKTILTDDGAAAFWFEPSQGPARVLGARFDAAGNALWTGTVACYSTVPSQKGRLDGTIGAGLIKLAWSDARADANDIYAQHVSPDGPPACYPDCNLDGQLTIADFSCFQSAFTQGRAYADCNSDGALTVADFACFQSGFVAGCP